MPEYLFKMYGHAKDTKRWSEYSADKIVIYNKDRNGQPIQEIPLGKTHSWDGRSLGLVVEDMNFDGYMDFRIQMETPAGPNVPYYYWLWHPDSSTFVSSKDLEEITSPEFDADSKTIHSFVRESAVAYSDNTYVYRDGIPTLIRRIERKADRDGRVWNIIIKDLQNQTLKVTGFYQEKITD